MYQSGDYGCSTYKIDMLVDLANSTKGVLGAQVAGAGLGGCIMALVKEEALETLRERLIKKYYEPFNLEPIIDVCIPVKGSGYIEIGR